MIHANPLVTKLFLDLQLAKDVQRRVPRKAAEARQFERMAWGI
jgi:hypothetical protein